MATYAWTRTREQVRDRIARHLGVYESGQTLDAEDSEVILEGIAVRLRELAKRKVLWSNVTPAQATVSLASGVASASLSALTDFLFPVTAMLVIGTDQREVEIIGHRVYQTIPDKTSQGEPYRAYFAGSTVYVWPVPQANYNLKLTYEAIAADTEYGTALDIPVEFIRPFSILVAADLCSDFDVPTSKAALLMGQTESAIRDIRALNAERVNASTVTPEWF
jgi:hypothetical protein